MTITNKFRADVGLREKYFVELPLEYVVHYLKNTAGAPTNPGLVDEVCLNINEDNLYKFDGTNWNVEPIDITGKYLFAGFGSNPAAGCNNIPDMQIYSKNGIGYLQRVARNGNVIYVRKSSKDFSEKNLLVYDKDNNQWVRTSASLSDEEFGLKLSQQVIAGSRINIVYNNIANTITISSNNITSEEIDDRVATLLQAGEGIDIVYNDGADTLTLSSELSESGDNTANKGISSFNLESFSVSAGYVSLSTVDGGNFV